jgi:hypothetical protein
VFLTDFETLDDRINTLLDDGYAAVWCDGCNGITAVIPLTNGGGSQ